MIHLIFSFIGLLLILVYNYITKTLRASFLHPTLITIGFSSLIIFVYRNELRKWKDSSVFSETLKEREKVMELLGYKTSTYFFSIILATTDYFLLYFIQRLIFDGSQILVIIFVFIVYSISIAKYQKFNEILKIATLLFIYNLTGISILSHQGPCKENFILQEDDIHTYPISAFFQSRFILIIILMILLFRKILLHQFDKQYKKKLCVSAQTGQMEAGTFCCGLLKPCPLLNIGVYGMCMITYGICNLFGSDGVDIFLRQSFSLFLVEILYCGLVCATTCILLCYTYMSKKFYEFCLVVHLIKFYPTALDISIEDRNVVIKIPFNNFGSTFPFTEAYGFLWAALYILHVFIVMILRLSIVNDNKFNMGYVIDLFSKDKGLKLWQQMFVINQIDLSSFHINILYFGFSLILFITCRVVSKST